MDTLNKREDSADDFEIPLSIKSEIRDLVSGIIPNENDLRGISHKLEIDSEKSGVPVINGLREIVSLNKLSWPQLRKIASNLAGSPDDRIGMFLLIQAANTRDPEEIKNILMKCNFTIGGSGDRFTNGTLYALENMLGIAHGKLCDLSRL